MNELWVLTHTQTYTLACVHALILPVSLSYALWYLRILPARNLSLNEALHFQNYESNKLIVLKVAYPQVIENRNDKQGNKQHGCIYSSASAT